MSSTWVPLMERSEAVGEVPVRLGHATVDAYLRFVWARTRHNTLLAVAFDLKVFFTVVGKDPAEVTTADVLGFIEAQRLPVRGANVVRLEDGEVGLSADDPAPVVERVGPVRVSGRNRPGRKEPGPSWPRHPVGPAARGAIGAVAADSSTDSGSRRGRLAGVIAADKT